MAMKLKSVDPQEESEAYRKILGWFFSFPTKAFSLTELSIELKIAKSNASRIVEELIEDGFLKKEVLGRIWRVTCQQNHPYFTTKKIGLNLMAVYESGVLEKIPEIVPSPKEIILFGSYRKGDDIETSGIDIAVEVADEEEMKIIPLGIVPRLGYRKNVPVNLHIFSRKKIDRNLFANIANGIVLEGFLEVRP